MDKISCKNSIIIANHLFNYNWTNLYWHLETGNNLAKMSHVSDKNNIYYTIFVLLAKKSDTN